MTGASGLIGSALSIFWKEKGYEVTSLERFPSKQALEDLDVVIHLAGEPILGLWTPKKKQAIFDSRIQITEHLQQTFSLLKKPPKAWIVASGIGYYGAQAKGLCTEKSLPGDDFLASLCKENEGIAQKYNRGRVVLPRFGVVLSGTSFLKNLVPWFRFGLGATLGSGKEWMSWIALEDVLQIFEHLLKQESLKGPINLCSPQPVTSKEFSQSIAQLLKRPLFLRIPGWILRFFLGEMAQSTLLSSIQAKPQKLLDQGIVFHYPELKEALSKILTSHV